MPGYFAMNTFGHPFDVCVVANTLIFVNEEYLNVVE